jgi:hypothetical protein
MSSKRVLWEMDLDKERMKKKRYREELAETTADWINEIKSRQVAERGYKGGI